MQSHKYYNGVILSAIMFIASIYPFLLNGFPLFFADTAAYLDTVSDLVVPLARSFFYGLPLWVLSHGVNLPVIVIFQSGIVLFSPLSVL